MTSPIAARLRQLADAATPGPWDAVKAGDERGNPSPMYRGLVCILEAGKNGVSVVAESGWVPKENWHPNADFIAACRDGVPALLAEIDASQELMRMSSDNNARLTQKVEALTAALDGLLDLMPPVASPQLVSAIRRAEIALGKNA